MNIIFEMSQSELDKLSKKFEESFEGKLELDELEEELAYELSEMFERDFKVTVSIETI